MHKLRIGLIGFGAWTRNAYLPALQHDGRAVVSAVTASSEKTRQYARQLLGADAAVFESYEDLLSQAELDAVMVAVPDSVHQAALTRAIKSGLAVFYEPPVSDTREQIPVVLRQLLAAPQVTFAHLELCNHPVIARATELIKSGTIGSLHDATITLNADWGCAADSDICLQNRMSCWYAGLLNQLIGSVPSRVLVLDGHGGTGRMQAISTGIYDYNGCWGVFRANVTSPEECSIVVEIRGDQGEISLNYFTGELRYRFKQHPEWIAEEVPPLTPCASWPGVRETVTAFLDSVISGGSGRGNAKAVAQLCMIGLAAEESKDSGTWAEVHKQ